MINTVFQIGVPYQSNMNDQALVTMNMKMKMKVNTKKADKHRLDLRASPSGKAK